jgi:hypothetical protein
VEIPTFRVGVTEEPNFIRRKKPTRWLWVGSVLLEDTYFDSLIHTPAPGYSNSSA